MMKWILLATLPLCAATLFAAQGNPQPPGPSAQTASTPKVPAKDEYVGDDTCMACHESEAKSLASTLHGKAKNERAPAARLNSACETCHGPGKEHSETGDKAKIRVFTSMKPRDVSAVCTSCHNRSTHALWKGSVHDARNLSCISCHSVHSPKSEYAQLKADTITDTCVTCHKTEVAKLQRFGHMPVREGCSTCHDPHGSNNERMLVAKLPMLCQRCHIGTRHPSTIYDGVQLTARSNRLIGRGCVNCHAQIHGSNSPAGNAFLR